jgi:hypothetical protein
MSATLARIAQPTDRDRQRSVTGARVGGQHAGLPDQRGGQRVHGDTIGCYAWGKVVRQAVQAGLASRVMGSDDTAVERGDRGHEQHPPEPTFHHRRKDPLGQQKRHGQIHRQRLVPQTEVDVAPICLMSGSGVGHQDVYAAHLFFGLLDELSGSGRVLEIGPGQRHPTAQRAGITGRFVGVIAVLSVCQEQIDADICQPSRNGLANTPRGAGEQRDATAQYGTPRVVHGLTRIRIGLPSCLSSFLMPTAMSSSGTMSLIERDKSSRPRDTRVASVSISTFL